MTTQPDWNDSAQYQITVKGILGTRWHNWFEGMTVESSGSVTKITGTDLDQAALHGILGRVRDLGLTLISVTRIEA